MDIQNELEKKAALFNAYWQQYLRIKQPTILYKATQYLPAAGGKRFRPFLTMLCCESVSGDPQRALP